METIELFGVTHTYELTPPSPDADRPVLIFIHGWLLSRQYWRPLVERLAPEYQCLCYDLRGFGDSSAVKTDQPPEQARPYHLAAYAQDLVALLAQLQIHQAWLIGHSLGGSIALWAAELAPSKIQGVICLNSGGGIFLKEEFERFRRAGCQIVNSRQPWLAYIPGLDWLFTRAMVARPLSRNWGRQRLDDFLKADREAALGALLETTTEPEVHHLPQLVARLSQPVFFLAGQQDRVMELQYVRHLASFHPGFQQRDNVIELADCGHLSMVEQTSLVEAHIRDLVADACSRSSPSIAADWCIDPQPSSP
ncbi:alpha/beta hydrolase [Spirulina sp. CCNP1310]|uniref:alpha/beta fold hydrolase n=1 Tax=Spirulina sp. CCNP1310 TaxID=3110249 RepID=UPI002B208CFB|nr:alpha/beta hydrolase [Spirulina sp. CCNP1310]MEA5419861.1 alpha/beta hydrolase [Spirulina sp. CCNP1310]